MDFKVIKLPPKTTKTLLETINFHPKTSLKTTRFFKNKNIIEFNKQNIELNHLSHLNPRPYKQNSEINHLSHLNTKPYKQNSEPNHINPKTNKQNIEPNHLNPKPQIQLQYPPNSKRNSTIAIPKQLKAQRSTMTTSSRSSLFQADHKQSIFSPRIKQQIIKRHTDCRKTYSSQCTRNDSKLINPCCDNKPSLQRLLIKNNISAGRCLMGMNIPHIQQTHSFSRFDLFNLYTYYKTLLSSTNRSVSQLRKGFQSIMHMNQIQLNSQMIERMFSQFLEEISFSNFIKVYGNIQNLLFTQNIIEYMLTVFSQFYKEEHLTSVKIFQALKDHLDEAEALQIKKMLYQYYTRSETQDLIQVKEILHACSQNLSICKRIFNGKNKQPAPKDNNDKK